jgi:hypothetical protein
MKHILMILIATVLVGFAFPPTAHGQHFLMYEPATVELDGRLVIQSKYGPPNFGEQPKTDQKVQVPVLLLRERVSVLGDRGDRADGPNTKTEYGVAQIQLAFTGAAKDHKLLIGKQVVVTGTLFHAHTGHHYTDVVMNVQSIEAKPIGYDQREFDICRINTSEWYRREGYGSSNTELVDFRAPVGEDATRKSFKHAKSGLIINVGVEHEFDFMSSKRRPLQIRIALAVSKTEEEDAFEVVDNAEAGTAYKPDWGGLYVRKTVVVGDIEHTVSLYCFDRDAKWYKQLAKR